MITTKDLYSVLTHLVIHAESISWNRLYNFLTCNSILLLAWATVYASTSTNPDCRVVLTVFCILGAVSGIVWAELGRRGREYLDHYGNQAKKLEKQANAFSPDVPEDLWLFQFVVEGPWYGKSRWILRLVPYMFTVIYCVLFVVSLRR